MSNESEYICEVVKVIELKKHPGADRLEIASIATSCGPTSHTIIVRVGDFKEGDLAEYFGVDCVIPPGHEQFGFLFTSKTTPHRVRAQRLRGIYSEGILLPLYVSAEFGDDLSDVYSINQWVPLIERNQSKGPTPPDTTVRGKAVYLGPDYSVLSLKKLPNVFEPGEAVVVTEKMHGSNFRCAWKSGWFGKTFYVGSHHANKTPRPEGIWNQVKHFFRKAWRGDTATGVEGNHYYKTNIWWETCQRLNIAKRISGYPNYVFYGELIGPGIQHNYSYTLTRHEILFYDVYDLNTRSWLTDWETANVLADCMLPVPYIWYIGDYDAEVVRELAEGLSAVDGKTQKEGVVVSRLNGPRLKAKLVSQGYLLQKDDRD